MNLEDELARMMSYTESGLPLQIVNGRVEIEESAAPDIAAPLQQPDAFDLRETRKIMQRFEPLRSAFSGQPPGSIALGTPGDIGAAARIKPTEFEKGFGGGVAQTIQQTLNLGAELTDYVGGLLGKDPQALDAIRNLIPQFKPDTTFGEIVKTVTNVGTSFALFRGMGMRNVPALTASEALVDPEQGNLASIAVQLGFAPELFKYLDSKVGKDADAEERLLSRMTNVLVDVGLGAAIGGIFAGVKVLKGEGGQYVDKIKDLLRDEELAKGGGQTLFSTPVTAGKARIAIDPLPVVRSDARQLLLDSIDEASKKYKYVGIRTSKGPVDVTQKSRMWIDGEPTKKMLPGLAVTDAKNIPDAMIFHGFDKPTKWNQGVYSGDHIAVVGSNVAPKKGEDPSELLFKNPKIFKQFNKPKTFRQGAD